MSTISTLPNTLIDDRWTGIDPLVSRWETLVDDHVYISITHLAIQYTISGPVFVTRALLDRYLNPPAAVAAVQDLTQRIRDLLRMYHITCQRAGSYPGMSRRQIEFILPLAMRTHTVYTQSGMQRRIAYDRPTIRAFLAPGLHEPALIFTLTGGAGR